MGDAYYDCDMNTFADRVRLRREELTLSQTDLARISGVSQSTIAQIEGGRNKGSKHIIALADALQVSARWLQEGEGEALAPITGSARVAQKANVGVGVGSVIEQPAMAAIRTEIDRQHAAGAISDDAATLLRAALGAAAQDQEPANRAAVLLMLTTGLRAKVTADRPMPVDPPGGDSKLQKGVDAALQAGLAPDETKEPGNERATGGRKDH